MISINPTTKSTATNKLEEILKANKRTRKSIPNYFDKAMESYGKALIKSSQI